jgi:hypothetical protein
MRDAARGAKSRGSDLTKKTGAPETAESGFRMLCLRTTSADNATARCSARGRIARKCQSERLARPRRFERPTPAFGGQYSIQLSYGRVP